MIKIAYLITGLYTGGAENMLYKLLSKINREHFDPVVISLLDRGTLGDRIESLGIPVYTVGMKRGIPTPATLLRLIQILRLLQPDLIQGWMYHGNIAAFAGSLSLLRKVPICWSIHFSISSLKAESLMTQAIIQFGSLISNFCAQNIFVSKNSQIQHESIGYSVKNSCVIPNGFDTELFKPSQSSRLNFRKELGLTEEAILIGLFARYNPMKDHANFLKAAKLLIQQSSNVHFVLAGNQINGENQTLIDLIQELGICSQVHLLGERQDISYLAPALDIFSLSSAYGEAFPLVVGEAMSCGVPCVVTDIGDSAWIIGDTGKVVPPQNPEQLAIAWQSLINLGTEGRKALGKMARERIQNMFSLESVTIQYENLYKTLMAK